MSTTAAAVPILEMTPEELGGATARQSKKTCPTPKGYRALGLQITPTSWKVDLSKCNLCGESRAYAEQQLRNSSLCSSASSYSCVCLCACVCCCMASMCATAAATAVLRFLFRGIPHNINEYEYLYEEAKDHHVVIVPPLQTYAHRWLLCRQFCAQQRHHVLSQQSTLAPIRPLSCQGYRPRKLQKKLYGPLLLHPVNQQVYTI